MEAVDSITAVICTRNRPDDLARAASSLLKNPEADAILIVDQSTNNDSGDMLRSIGAFRDSRVDYIHTINQSGLSRSRNVALEAAQTSHIAFTDDDCVVAPTWASEHKQIFAQNPSVGLVFATVNKPVELEGIGWTPTYEPTETGIVKVKGDPVNVFGIGANMSMKTSLRNSVGGFDVNLGAGSGHFNAGEDTDYAYRVWKAGQEDVLISKDPAVLHYGMRSEEAGVSLRQGYAKGMAGFLAKHDRDGDQIAGKYLRGLMQGKASEVVHGLISRRPRPSGLRELVWYARSVVDSNMNFRVDHQTHQLVAR